MLLTYYFCFMTSDVSCVEISQCTEDEVKEKDDVIVLENAYDVLPLYKRWCICSVLAKQKCSLYTFYC